MIPQSVQVFQVENAKLQHLYCREMEFTRARKENRYAPLCGDRKKNHPNYNQNNELRTLFFGDEENMGTPRLSPEVIKQRYRYYCTLAL